MSTAGRWALAALACLLGASAEAATDASGGTWNFAVSLDGDPIGEHRFEVTPRGGGERDVKVDARFDVKLLGFTAYRYRHAAAETWRGGCLAALTATTDDDGKKTAVTAEKPAGQADAPLAVTAPAGKQALPGCVMTFAYWNPAMQKQSHLLNPQTGRYEEVQISTAGNATIDVRGQAVPARRLRITGPEQPIDLWYSPQGDWLGLDSTVSGGRKLSYRLK